MTTFSETAVYKHLFAYLNFVMTCAENLQLSCNATPNTVRSFSCSIPCIRGGGRSLCTLFNRAAYLYICFYYTSCHNSFGSNPRKHQLQYQPCLLPQVFIIEPSSVYSSKLKLAYLSSCPCMYDCREYLEQGRLRKG